MGRVVPFSLRIACCIAALAALAATQQPAAPAPAPETFVLEGRVVDLRGDGVPAAKVWIATKPPPEAAVAQTIADGEGYFRMKAPQLEWMNVHATGDGTCRGVAFARRGTQGVRIDVHDAVTVRGVLRGRDGKPRKNVPVRAYPDGRELHNSYDDARTDDEGRFELTRVPLGPTRVVAWVDGEGLAEVEQRIAADCDVVLAPLADKTVDVRIEVAGLSADAIRDARVRLLPYANGSLRQLPPPLDSVRLDASGTTQLTRLPDHEYRVRVDAGGFVIDPSEVTAEPHQGPHVLKFTATRAVANELEWKATVAGPDGKPVAGIPFVLRKSSGGKEARATSDADGELTFQCPLAIGTDVIVYTTDARWAVDQEKVEGMSGAWDRRFLHEHECKIEPSAPLALRVVPACSVKGRLLRPDGQPAAFVDVQLEETLPGRMPEWMTMAWATTDRQGHFVFRRLHHFADAVRVMVNASDGAVTGEALAIATAGTVVTSPELKLSAPAMIEGVVRDAQQPAGGVRVWLRSPGNGNITEVVTDRLGRYRFLGAPPGRAYLEVLDEPGERHSSRATDPFDVEPGKTHTYDLQLPAK